MKVRRTLAGNQIIRYAGTRFYRGVARLSFYGDPPKVLANSMPKSGTHLLVRLLSHVPDMRFTARHINMKNIPGISGLDSEVSTEAAKYDDILKLVRNGQFLTGHVPCIPAVHEVLDRMGFKILVILRDPRDVVVSHAHYVLARKDHWIHGRFITAHPDIDSAITACIEGLPADPVLGGGLPDMDTRINDYIGWLDAPGALAIRFEDLVGSAGGGDDGRQLQTIRRVCSHVQRPEDTTSCRRLADAIWTTKAITFRSGKIGDWRRYFSAEHIESFKRVAGRSLVKMGYETRLDW